MTIAGRVAIVPKGDYSSTTAYEKLDLVRYENDLYVAKKANSGITPTDETAWMLCMENVTQAQYDDLISGAVQVASAKEAGNSTLHEGFTAKQVGESGARNLFKYPYNQTTRTSNGIEWTDLGDGRIMANGMATALSDFYLTKTANQFELIPGTYTLSWGCDGASTATYNLTIRAYTKSDATLVKTVLSSSTITTATITQEEADSWYFVAFLAIKSGVTVENLIFEPMLELGSIAHDFVPYHFGGAEDAKTVNGFAIYTDISQLGIESYHIPDIANAMQANSMFVAEVVSGHTYALSDSNNAFPVNNGTLEIVKPSSKLGARTRVILYTGTNVSKGDVYYCNLNENDDIINGWQAFNDGGNADTVGGYHASDFAKTADYGVKTVSSIETLGFTIDDFIADDFSANIKLILTTTPTRSFSVIPVNTITTLKQSIITKINNDVGASLLMASPLGLIITKPYTHTWVSEIKVLVNSAVGKQRIYTCTVDVEGETVIASKFAETYNANGFLPLDGSVPMSGGLSFNIGSNIFEVRPQSDGNFNIGGTNGKASTDSDYASGYLSIGLGLSIANRLRLTANGNSYVVHHDGNSAKVAIGPTAPSDTTALWYDTANNKWKRYVDGAWTS